MPIKVLLLILLLPCLTATAQQRHSDTADDLLEHLPLVTNVALKLCGVKSSTADSWEYGANVIRRNAVAALDFWGV